MLRHENILILKCFSTLETFCEILVASGGPFSKIHFLFFKGAKISVDKEKLEAYVLGDRRKEVNLQALNIVSELILMDEMV